MFASSLVEEGAAAGAGAEMRSSSEDVSVGLGAFFNFSRLLLLEGGTAVREKGLEGGLIILSEICGLEEELEFPLLAVAIGDEAEITTVVLDEIASAWYGLPYACRIIPLCRYSWSAAASPCT